MSYSHGHLFTNFPAHSPKMLYVFDSYPERWFNLIGIRNNRTAKIP